MVELCANFECAVILNSNNYSETTNWFNTPSNYDFLAGIDAIKEPCNHFKNLQLFAKESKDWLFGYISYDAKNSIEHHLTSKNRNSIGFDEVHFFEPRFVVIGHKDSIKIGFLPNENSKEEVLELILKLENGEKKTTESITESTINQTVTKTEYTKTVNIIKDHILKGDVYELNYCIEFNGEKIALNPSHVYNDLTTLSPTPFSAFLKQNNRYLLSASPERYIKKYGQKIISQPIKGTAKRGATAQLDKQLISDLKNSPKEQAENIMITDLVRNDLSRIAKRGTVRVEELLAVYSFPQVHQLISTVSAQVKENINWVDILTATFPMGSMTGAPKIKAMQLIDQYEVTKRGLYSGAVGYITPEGNFDFNVVIRSLLYNAENQLLSFMVGSAITASSDAESEYEECLLKASALLKVINGKL